MEVTKVRPNYSATEKGSMIGAGAGLITGAGVYGLVCASTLPLKINPSREAKRLFINQYSDQYSRMGIDMSKTTVSKVIDGAKKAFKSPVTVAMGVAGAALIGAGIGFIVDKVKNNSAKKDTKIS